MSFIAQISFIDVAFALVALGMFERFVIPNLPTGLVGPDGWLLKTN